MKNDLYELTRKRRSVRRYGDKHIDDEIISEIISRWSMWLSVTGT